MLPMGIDDLAERESWQVEEVAARVHYRGEGGRYSVEYYGPTDCVIYWRVSEDAETAVPIERGAVPDGLRARIREDLEAVGLDPAAEDRPV